MTSRNTHFLSLMFVVLLSAHAARAFAADPPAARSSYWRERTSFFEAFARQADVVMIGDSLTNAAEWREMFPDRIIVNRGIDSDTTDGVLARLGSVLSLKPQEAFIMIGVNDFAAGRDVETVFADYRAIVSRLEQSGAKVFVQSTLPCNEAKGAWKACSSINGKIRQLNVRLSELASSRVTFIDLTSTLTAGTGLKSELTYDGVHLNGEGYRRWQAAISPFMPAGHRSSHQKQ